MNTTTHAAVSTLIDNFVNFIITNPSTLFVASAGGLILGILKLVGHSNRDEKAKLSHSVYFWYLMFCIIALPVLGGFVTSLYILNGDKIQPLLALQIGLTSPAIVTSLLSGTAHVLQAKPMEVPETA